MELINLLEMNEQIRSFNSELHLIMTEIESVTGLLYAVDSTFEQDVLDMGKLLPNESARKLAKDVMRKNHENYTQWVDRLLDLKQQKIMISYERDSLKTELDLHVVDIKRSTAKQEASNMATWVDQTNYLQALEQDKMFAQN